MFQHEDFVKGFKEPSLMQKHIHYNRGTFAALLSLVKSRVCSDWKSVMTYILDMISTDRRF
jgi:hypothetical protein